MNEEEFTGLFEKTAEMIWEMSPNQHRQKDTNGIPSVRCHYFLRGGMIQFLGDCDHNLKNKTVECPDY